MKNEKSRNAITYGYYPPGWLMWFEVVGFVIMAIGVGWILGNLLVRNLLAWWKAILILSPFLFMLWTSFRIVRNYWVFRKVDEGKSVTVDFSQKCIFIEQEGETFRIHQSDLLLIREFEAWAAVPPMSEFEYVEFILKNGQSYIVTSFTAEIDAFSVVFLRGVKRERKVRWMHTIRKG